ncbi:MAG: hypothetical protein WBL50_14975 [Candidatus Acidiferrum sp.]
MQRNPESHITGISYPVEWRERSSTVKVIWFILIMALANIAMSLYVLIQIFSLTPEEPLAVLFRQKAR